MNSEIEWREGQTDALQAVMTEAALLDVLTATAQALGFEHCAYGLRMPLPVSNPKMMLLNNYPDAWRQRYVEQNYLAVDPTVAHGIKSVAPVLWSEKLFHASPTFWEDARSHGLNVGWAQSAYDARGAVGMLTLARSADFISESELRNSSLRMSWLVGAVHEAGVRIATAASVPEAQVMLTPREVEILRWTADGKTSGEVGQIMGITERTVNFHVTNALAKLGTVNKTAGVVKAAMLRLI